MRVEGLFYRRGGRGGVPALPRCRAPGSRRMPEAYPRTDRGHGHSGKIERHEARRRGIEGVGNARPGQDNRVQGRVDTSRRLRAGDQAAGPADGPRTEAGRPAGRPPRGAGPCDRNDERPRGMPVHGIEAPHPAERPCRDQRPVRPHRSHGGDPGRDRRLHGLRFPAKRDRHRSRGGGFARVHRAGGEARYEAHPLQEEPDEPRGPADRACRHFREKCRSGGRSRPCHRRR